MKNKLVSFLIFIFFICIFGAIVWYKLESRTVYIPDIPNSYNLSSIVYELESGSETIASEEAMDKVLDGIYNLNLSTKSVSVEDYPNNVENLVAIRLYYRSEDTLGSFYIYKRKDKYYFEEPYNGVYKISEEEYNYIIDLIK